MKNLLSNNWQAKFVSLVIAVAIWSVLRNMNDDTFFDRTLSWVQTLFRSLIAAF